MTFQILECRILNLFDATFANLQSLLQVLILLFESLSHSSALGGRRLLNLICQTFVQIVQLIHELVGAFASLIFKGLNQRKFGSLLRYGTRLKRLHPRFDRFETLGDLLSILF